MIVQQATPEERNLVIQVQQFVGSGCGGNCDEPMFQDPAIEPDTIAEPNIMAESDTMAEPTIMAESDTMADSTTTEASVCQNSELIPEKYGSNLCLHESKLNYDDAEDLCKGNGGDLMGSAGPDIVGLRQYLVDNGKEHRTWLNIFFEEEAYYWGNWEPISHPLDFGSFEKWEGCVLFGSEFFQLSRCEDEEPFICQYD